MDAPGGYEWIRGDELVLTSAYFLAKDKDIQTELMPQLSRLGVAAVALKLRRFLDAMPEVMIEHANEYHIPLIELPYSVAWIDVINPVMSEILNLRRPYFESPKKAMSDSCWSSPEAGCGLSSPSFPLMAPRRDHRPVNCMAAALRIPATSMVALSPH